MPVVGSPLENGRHSLSDEQLSSLVDYERGRVHASVYTDEDVFAEEMRRIFHRSWVYLAHESEVALPGDYKTTYIGQIPVIISRTEDGRDARGRQPVRPPWDDGVPDGARERELLPVRVPRLDVSKQRRAHRYHAEERLRARGARRHPRVVGDHPSAGVLPRARLRLSRPGGATAARTSSASRLTTSTIGWMPHRRARSSSPVACGGIAIGRTGRSASKGRMSGTTSTSSTRPCEC